MADSDSGPRHPRSPRMSHTVFISHCEEDTRFVERTIVRLLRRHGVEPSYLVGETSWEAGGTEPDLRVLRECAWFLLVMSPRSERSEWVRAETEWVLRNRGHNR